MTKTGGKVEDITEEIGLRLSTQTKIALREEEKDDDLIADLEDGNQAEKDEKQLRMYRMEEVSGHWDLQSCWIVLSDKVYDITSFVSQHPAGDEIILEHAGHDATVAFHEVGHSKDAQQTLDRLCIGVLADSDCIIKK